MAKFTTTEIPEWITETEINHYDKNFIRILDFYLVHSPVLGLSAKCKSLQHYGWESPWKKPYWLNKQLKQASGNYELLFSAQSNGAMEQNLEEAGLSQNFPDQLDKERIGFVNTKKNQFVSVFGHIRNAFAHGRFAIYNAKGKKVFVLEDVMPGNAPKTVTARMIVHQDTLLKWINIIEDGQKEFIRAE